MNIKQLTIKLGLDEMYVRKLVTTGKIAATKSRVPGTEIPRWEISEEAVAAYLGQKPAGHTVRTDGRNKFTSYLNAAELAKITEFCKANGIPVPVKSNNYNPAKAKAKRAAKKGKTQSAEVAPVDPIAEANKLVSMNNGAVAAAQLRRQKGRKVA